MTAPQTRLRTLAALAAGVAALATGAVPAAVAAPAASAAAPATALGAVPVGVPAVAAPTVSRIAGADRYATSVAASKAAFPSGSTASVVYLVSGVAPARSYSAIPAAAVQNGSVLMSRPDGLPAVVAAELDRLNPSRVVHVGDYAALSTDVARGAARYSSSVSRVSASEPSTSQALNRAAFRSATKAWVVSRNSGNDSVIGAVAAAAHRSPVIVLDGTASDLPSANASLLRDLGVDTVTVVGPTAAVSSGIAADLAGIVGAGNVVRAAGSDRYGTAARVNALAWPDMAPGTAYLADGTDITNGIGGALLAGRTKRPLYWTVPYCTPSSVRPALAGPGVTRVTLLGGEASVRVLAGRLETCRSIDAASSVWVLVNKRNGLDPKSFVPSNLVVPSMPYADGHKLRSDAAAALARMASGSYAAGVGRIGIDTAYRSYATQKALYDKYLALKGRTWTDTWYLRAGYSEHQTGLTVDLLPIGRSNCRINDCIDETPQGVWLAKNAWRYGFILRYEKGRTSTTGVGFEPWHFRFVGTPLARAYRDGGWHTYEQFLRQPAAPRY